MKICIDAGHGGSDPGAIGVAPYRLEEKEFNLAVALLVDERLRAYEGVGSSYETLMTRRQDRTLGLGARAAFANRYEADFFVSIHANAAYSSDVEGMEVFHFPGSIAGAVGAMKVLTELVRAFPDHRNRGRKEANFTVLRETRMPAILVECEFLTNPRQLEFLADPENQKAIAQAIVDGIVEWAAG